MNVAHLGITAMTPKKFTVIEGGRDDIERDLVRALFGVDSAEIERLSAQLNAIAGKPGPKLKLVKNLENANSTGNASKTDS